MGTIAIIDGGVVTNIVAGDPSNSGLMTALEGGHAAAVDISGLSPEPGIGWHYDGSVFTAPPGPTLAQAKAANLAVALAAVETFVESRYSLGVQNSFRNIYTLAVLNGLTTRAAYCLQLMTWAQSVVSFSATYVATVNAQTDVGAVQALTPDFTALIASDPLVTPVAAIQIVT